MSLVDRAKNIIVSPKTEWPVVEGEEPNTGSIITGYVLPLALIPAVAQFIGYGVIGVSVPFVGSIHSITWGIGQAVMTLVGAILVVYLASFIINALAGSFGSEQNFGRAMQLVAYSYTPGWIAGIFYLYPTLGVLSIIASIYGLYVMYLGFPHTMKTPKDKVVIYMIVSIVVLVILTFIIMAILGLIVAAVGLGAVGAFTSGM